MPSSSSRPHGWRSRRSTGRKHWRLPIGRWTSATSREAGARSLFTPRQQPFRARQWVERMTAHEVLCRQRSTDPLFQDSRCTGNRPSAPCPQLPKPSARRCLPPPVHRRSGWRLDRYRRASACSNCSRFQNIQHEARYAELLQARIKVSVIGMWEETMMFRDLGEVH